MDKRTDLHAGTDIQKSDPLGTVQLMPAGAEHIDVVRIHIDGYMGIGLDRVGVEQDPIFLSQLPDRLDRLHGADLIIGEHHRDQDRIGADRFL